MASQVCESRKCRYFVYIIQQQRSLFEKLCRICICRNGGVLLCRTRPIQGTAHVPYRGLHTRELVVPRACARTLLINNITIWPEKENQNPKLKRVS